MSSLPSVNSVEPKTSESSLSSSTCIAVSGFCLPREYSVRTRRDEKVATRKDSSSWYGYYAWRRSSLRAHQPPALICGCLSNSKIMQDAAKDVILHLQHPRLSLRPHCSCNRWTQPLNRPSISADKACSWSPSCLIDVACQAGADREVRAQIHVSANSSINSGYQG